MSDCTHDCSSCSSTCSSRTAESLKKPLREGASVKKVIAVVSGKGGVGKSLITALLASRFARDSYKVAVLDADITGPSVPKMFGVTDRAMGDKDGAIYPVYSREGVQMMSMNLLLEDETQPVLWRGSLIAGAALQFWTDVLWEDVDYMFVDMPPGTGDVPLSVYQSLPISGIIIVTTPQDLVKMIVEKAVNMANMMNIPILGLVENMSFISCPDCGKKIELFGKSKADKIAAEFLIPAVAKLPVDPTIAESADLGEIFYCSVPELEGIYDCIVKNVPLK